MNKTPISRPAAFPLKISPNRRYLVDQKNIPFIIQGDTAWSIISALTDEEVENYLRNRVDKGFNAMIVSLIERVFHGPQTRAGVFPFLNMQDLSTPNEGYFVHADWVLKRAEENGILVFLTPMYLGYAGARNNEGWFHEARLSGSAKCFQYGEYIGRRYKDFKNIMWMIGGDRNPDEVEDEVNSLVHGIKAGDPQAVFTAHPAPESVTIHHYGGSDQGGWLDISTTYTYKIVHNNLLEDYYRKPAMPNVLIESAYEGEHNASTTQIRRQAYWAILCGACGQFLGNNPIWLFDPGWQDAMDLEGSRSMVHWRSFFTSRPWYDLVPDQHVSEGTIFKISNHSRFILAGGGEFRGLDTLTAARTSDGNTLMAYLPTAREFTVDLREIAGREVNAWWFDPRTGEAQHIGEYSTGAPQSFTPPGSGDWGLVIDNAALNLPAPGS